MKYHRQSFTRDLYRLAANVIPDPAPNSGAVICELPRRPRGCRRCEEYRSAIPHKGIGGRNVTRLSSTRHKGAARGIDKKVFARNATFRTQGRRDSIINKLRHFARFCSREHARDSATRLPIFEYLICRPVGSIHRGMRAARSSGNKNGIGIRSLPSQRVPIIRNTPGPPILAFQIVHESRGTFVRIEIRARNWNAIWSTLLPRDNQAVERLE